MPSDFHNTNYSRKCVLKTIGEYLPHVSNDNPWKNRKMFLYSLWLKTYSVRWNEFGGEPESDIKKWIRQIITRILERIFNLGCHIQFYPKSKFGAFVIQCLVEKINSRLFSGKEPFSHINEYCLIIKLVFIFLPKDTVKRELKFK